METASGTYGSENRSVEEMTRYLNGLKRYTEKGIPIYMDGKLSGQREWEKLFEVREDGMFYMGDYVQAEEGIFCDMFLPAAVSFAGQISFILSFYRIR